jgi:acetyl esterase/lipase
MTTNRINVDGLLGWNIVSVKVITGEFSKEKNMAKTSKHSINRALRVSIFVFAAMMVLLGGAVLAASGPSPRGGAGEVKSLTYKTVGDRELKIHINYPPEWKPSDARPAIVFFFGGAWTSGTVEQFALQAEYFASRGLVAARADYRIKSKDAATPDKCVEDARSAVRWMRKNSKLLGIDPKKLIVSGGSAGGHLAACMMIEKSVEAAGDDLSISTVPQAMVLFNPVLNFENEEMMKRFGVDKEVAGKISPTLHLTKKSPPALILFGTEDRLKVHGEEYWKKAEALGVRAENFLAEGQGHGFFNRSPWLERTMVAADKFLASLGYLKGEPTVKIPEQATVEQRGGDVRSRMMSRWLAMDKDSDGKISRDEAQGRMKDEFDKMDSNKDGFIDREEVRQMVARLRGGEGERPLHPDTSGWENLFTVDLSNAAKPEGVWTVSEGVLTASEDQAIWTTRDYDNFILDLEFKTAPGTNSGVVVCCSDTKDWIPNSVEVQIADDYAEEWAKQPATWHCGAIFGHLAPTKSMVKKPGEWNRFTVTRRDKKIDVVLNGELVTSMDMSLWTSAKTNPDGSEIPPWLSKPVASLPTKGKIGLQGKHAGAPIWFRNIKIKLL